MFIVRNLLSLILLWHIGILPLYSQSVAGTWSGTMRIEERLEGQIGKRTKTAIVNIMNNVATGRVNETDEMTINGKLMCRSDCSGTGPAQLWEVSFNKLQGTYTVHSMTSEYQCNYTGPNCEQSSASMHPFDILATDQHLPNQNPNALVGSFTTTTDIADMGTVTTTISWNLVRSIDVHLLVIPSDYDNWMPEPGPNEITKGNVIQISLKLQKGNGQPPPVKAKYFILEMEQTSAEPGITINAPINPQVDLPDLRFMLEPNAQLDNYFQWIKLTCNGCTVGVARIASFDGGGYTTLTAKAILEDDTEVIGRLLLPSGVTQIPIPKRSPGSNIAQKWRITNNNLKDDEDIEQSRGNNYLGDGLSAYEEYRGVIREGMFKRLDPMKKELGVKMKRAEFALFTGGIRLLEKEADIKVIRFFENEIGNDRRLNKNAGTAHIVRQYALKLEKDKLEPGVMGQNEPLFPGPLPKIPERSTRVAVDIDQAIKLENYYIAHGINGMTPLQEEIAATVAHELGHGLGISHHGPGSFFNGAKTTFYVRRIDDVVLNTSGDTIRFRPYPLGKKNIGRKNSVESGDLSCFMAYTDWYRWAVNDISNLRFIFAEVPNVLTGQKLCVNADGTGINAKPNYFYEATKGNCVGKMKFKD